MVGFLEYRYRRSMAFFFQLAFVLLIVDFDSFGDHFFVIVRLSNQYQGILDSFLESKIELSL